MNPSSSSCPSLCLEPLEDRLLLSITLAGMPSWTFQGPAGIRNGQVLIPPDNPVAGGINRIAVDPGNPASVYVGAVNGGIWHTTNVNAAHPTWTPLLDAYPSLSIGALAFSPLDSSGATLFAGIGRFSNAGGDGGPQNGVLRTRDGGQHWTLLGQRTFRGVDIVRVLPTSIRAPAGQVLLVGASSGLFLSRNGGASFHRLTVAPARPGAAVSDLVGDPADPDRFYVALPGVGVYRGLYDPVAQTIRWTAINGTGGQGISGRADADNLLLALHSTTGQHVLYAAVDVGGSLAGVFRSVDDGGHWSRLGTAPGVNQGQQGAINLCLAADPVLPDRVYVGGDVQLNEPFVGNLFVGNATTSRWSTIVERGAHGTAPHADSRCLAFAGPGELLEADDGGLYRLSQPALPARRWSSANGNLGTTEFYSVAYDSTSHVFLGGAQDVGSAEQTRPDSTTWQQVQLGDSTAVAVASDGRTSTRYDVYASDPTTLQRRSFDHLDRPLGRTTPLLLAAPGSRTSFSGLDPEDSSAGFDSNLFLATSQALPNGLLIGRHGLYESHDRGDHVTRLPIPNQDVDTRVSALVYGAAGHPAAVYLADDTDATLYLRPGASGPLLAVPGYRGDTILGIAVDSRNWQTVYVVDGTNVYRVTGAGTARPQWTRITGNLDRIDGFQAAGITDPNPRSVAFVRAGNSDVVIVGGRTGVYRATLTSGGVAPVWTRLSGPSRAGSYLPHVPVNEVHYNARADLLYVGTLGRGAWSLAHASDALAVTPTLHIASGTVELRRDPANRLLLDVFVGRKAANGMAAAPDAVVEASAIRRVLVNAPAGHATLILDGTYGLIGVSSISFNPGGSGNELELTGLPVRKNVRLTGTGVGSLTLGGTTVGFRNVRSIEAT